MSEKPKGTTIWSDVNTSKKLRLLAEYNRRNMADQLRWMIDREYFRLSREARDTLEKLEDKEYDGAGVA